MLGGLIVDTLGWEYIFLINVPVGVIALVMAQLMVPDLPGRSHAFDWLGVVLSVVGLFCIVFAIEEGEKYDWGTIVGPISVWGLIIVGVVVLALFIVAGEEQGVPRAKLTGTSFEAARMEGACFNRADLFAANLARADLSDASFQLTRAFPGDPEIDAHATTRLGFHEIEMGLSGHASAPDIALSSLPEPTPPNEHR